MSLDLEKLKELEAAATPGPWPSNYIDLTKLFRDDLSGNSLLMTGQVNLQLTVEMRNQLPTIFALFENWEAEKHIFLCHIEKLEREKTKRDRIEELEAAIDRWQSKYRLLEEENARLKEVNLLPVYELTEELRRVLKEQLKKNMSLREENLELKRKLVHLEFIGLPK